MAQVVAVQPRRERVLADLAPGRTLPAVRDIALIIGAAGLVGALAQVVIHVPGSPVPITGQTLGVLVSGSALGWRRGTLAMILYAAAGFAGVPWFESHEHGWSSPAAGYLFGKFVLAVLHLRHARRAWRRSKDLVLGALVHRRRPRDLSHRHPLAGVLPHAPPLSLAASFARGIQPVRHR